MNKVVLKANKLKVLPVIFLLVMAACSLSSSAFARNLPSGGTVAAVFDGDTILLETGEKIRYLGIDAPEVAHGGTPADCFGTEAKEANARWVFHKKVTLKYDHETVDNHGRLLAYVFSMDGKCVNAELLRDGFATVFRTSEGFGRWKDFVNYQREAIHCRKGMWANCTVKPALCYVGNRRSFIFHRPECPLGKKTSSKNAVRFQNRFAGLEEGYSPCRWCKP